MNKVNFSLRFLLLVFSVLLFSCKSDPGKLFEDHGAIFGLATTIELQNNETTIFVNDYFHSGAIPLIDSVSVHPSLRARLSADKSILYISQRNLNVPHITEVIFWIDQTPYTILTRRPVRKNHTFRFDPGTERYRSVAVRGDMTEWEPVPMTLVDGKWQLTLNLNPGRYQYLIVANGRDMIDPGNPTIVSNSSGGFNSLLEIGDSGAASAPRMFPAAFNGGSIEFELENVIEEIFVLWQNFRLPSANIEKQGNTIRVIIPSDARSMERSFIRVFANGRTAPGNDLLIPLQFGVPVTQPSLLTRFDREATIMYFLMVDRFFNGNPRRDQPIDDPQVAPRANFHGGDLDGVLKKIEDGYFTELGVNAVWFSPITQNPLRVYVEFPQPRRKYTGYHGYWPITLTTIDHRFGDDHILEKLVNQAHERGISVLLDFVSNHVHQDNPLIIENPHWATPLILPDGRRNIRLWDEHRLTTWFDEFLPSLDFSRPEVIQTMVDSAFYWIDRFNLDGFRHDATKHVPLEFWRALTKKLKEDKMIPGKKRLFQIGETFGSRELIASYIGSGLLDGKFEFNLYWDVRSVFALDEESFHRLDYSLNQTLSYYGFQNLMGNITGNHDMPRFISYAGGDLSFDEDATQAGWQREIGVGDPKGYKKLSALTAFTLTIPGIPVIYYGDEIGIPGGNDPDSRRPMVFEGLTSNEMQVKENLKKLTRLRTSNLAFIYGDFKTLTLTDSTYAYARRYFDNRAIVVFNKSNSNQMVSIDLPASFSGQNFQVHFGANVSHKISTLEVPLPPYSFEIITW